MQDALSPNLNEFCTTAEEIGANVLAPNAERVDREALWPEESMRALASAGLMGLLVPSRYGGHQQGLLALACVCETLARFCPSTAMCFGMHSVGTAVISAKASDAQGERYLRPIAAGRHITSLALSEHGTGAHFYLPQTNLRREDNSYVIQGNKEFITSGGHADSYVISAGPITGEQDPGEFNCLIVDCDASGLEWKDSWSGFGMRGNSSRSVFLNNVKTPVCNLLGQEGDQTWYVFEVIAPFFLMAMSGTYLGISQASLDYSVHHVRERKQSHTGESLADLPGIQQKVAQLWSEVAKGRALIYTAAGYGDAADPRALPALLASKAEIARIVEQVTNGAMSLCGGIAYRENSVLSRLLRDGRAAHVMAPTTDVLQLWLGRSVLGLPLL